MGVSMRWAHTKAMPTRTNKTKIRQLRNEERSSFLPRCHHNLHELPMDFGQEADDLATGMLLSTKIGKDFSKNYDRRGMRGREGL